jgi:hypothetical protein
MKSRGRSVCIYFFGNESEKSVCFGIGFFASSSYSSRNLCKEDDNNEVRVMKEIVL